MPWVQYHRRENKHGNGQRKSDRYDGLYGRVLHHVVIACAKTQQGAKMVNIILQLQFFRKRAHPFFTLVKGANHPSGGTCAP
jgi:hypothetical protein